MSDHRIKKVHIEGDEEEESKKQDGEQNAEGLQPEAPPPEPEAPQPESEVPPSEPEPEVIPAPEELVETEVTVTKLEEPAANIQQLEPTVAIEKTADEGLAESVPETGIEITSTGTTAEPTDPETDFETKLALLRQLSSDYFLQKHSPSFKCFEQYLCSTSDLRLTLNYFPPLVDPGLDDALNYIAPEEEPDPNGCDKYLKMCKDLAIVPISRVIKSLPTDTLNLKYYGLTLKQMRGIADALKVNSNIKYLILEDNWMSPEAVILIGDILRESNSIRVLNLKECRIGEEGAAKLCEGLASTQFLEELDLSFNSLGDKGLQLLQPCLIENTSIKKLNIGHNNLTEDSGETLQQILVENKALEELDLTWNGFYTGPGNKKMCNGLQKNGQIKWLSLAWNGIGTTTAMRPITKYLRKTKILEFIDLSWNRITQEALKMLKFALIRNKSLNHVKIGNNIFTPDEAYFMATLFNKAKNDLAYLDMEDMCVNKNFLQLKSKVRQKGKTVTHGHVLSNYEIYGPDINKLLFQRCKYLTMKPKKKKQKKDFGHFVLSLPDKPMTPQDFRDFLKKKKIKKLDKDLLQELLSRFPAKKQMVDCVGMKNAYMTLYPDTVLPEEKKKKKKKRKKGKGKKGKGAAKKKAKKA